MTQTTSDRASGHQTVLTVGLDPTPAITRAADDAGLRGVHVESLDHAADMLDEARPTAVLIDARSMAAGFVRSSLCAKAAQAGVPIIAIAGYVEVDGLGFADALGDGADDLCPRRRDPIARRLRAIVRASEAKPPQPKGRVVVIDRERVTRTLTGCALRNAGYKVVFAESGEEGLAASLAADTALVTFRLASCDDLTPGDALPNRARAGGSTAPWVFGASPKDLAEVRSRIAGVPGTTVYDAYGPAVDVLFVANELLSAENSEARTNARVLYGAVVRQRPAGGEHDELGYAYNVSAGGLYVRTLAPPERGTDLWLELRPPRTARRVRLEATVVWSRNFGANDRATVPPGFGAQITGATPGDMLRYVEGCEAFAAEQRGAPSEDAS